MTDIRSPCFLRCADVDGQEGGCEDGGLLREREEARSAAQPSHRPVTEADVFIARKKQFFKRKTIFLVKKPYFYSGSAVLAVSKH